MRREGRSLAWGQSLGQSHTKTKNLPVDSDRMTRQQASYDGTFDRMDRNTSALVRWTRQGFAGPRLSRQKFEKRWSEAYSLKTSTVHITFHKKRNRIEKGQWRKESLTVNTALSHPTRTISCSRSPHMTATNPEFCPLPGTRRDAGPARSLNWIRSSVAPTRSRYGSGLQNPTPAMP
jgi:hypothetical protein